MIENIPWTLLHLTVNTAVGYYTDTHTCLRTHPHSHRRREGEIGPTTAGIYLWPHWRQPSDSISYSGRKGRTLTTHTLRSSCPTNKHKWREHTERTERPVWWNSGRPYLSGQQPMTPEVTHQWRQRRKRKSQWRVVAFILAHLITATCGAKYTTAALNDREHLYAATIRKRIYFYLLLRARRALCTSG